MGYVIIFLQCKTETRTYHFKQIRLTNVTLMTCSCRSNLDRILHWKKRHFKTSLDDIRNKSRAYAAQTTCAIQYRALY